MGTYVALLLVLTALALGHGVEGTSCLRPRPLLHGRYEYQNSSFYGEEYLPVNFVVKVLCNPNTQLNGDEFIQCQPNGRWSGRAVCRAPTICPPPSQIENGFLRVRGRWAGGRAVYRCNPGFYLLGRAMATCNSNGEWTYGGDEPECVHPPSCQAPEIVDGQNLTASLRAGTGHVIGGLYTEHSVCAAECPIGFVPSRDYILTCHDGEWVPTGEIPECLTVTCQPPSLEPIPHGRSDAQNRTYFVGEAVSYRCDSGYRLAGKSWQVCNPRNNRDVDGSWSDRVPSCVVVTCPYPGRDHLRNGHVTFSNTSMTIGTKMTLRCNSLYTLLGSSERVCQADGTWNGTLTSCHREDYECRALGNPIHGSMYSLSGGEEVEPQFRIGETVYFRCDHDVNENNEPRYEMVGSRERFCNRNEEWTGEMPRCLERHEFDPAPIVNQGLGEIFDEIAVESGSWASNNDTNRAGSRRRRSIDLNNRRGIDIWFAFDSSGSIGDYNFKLAKRFAKGLVLKISQNGSLGRARIGALRYASQSEIAFRLQSGSTTDQVNRLIHVIPYEQRERIGSGTSIFDALETIRTQVSIGSESQPASLTNKRFLFLITDGMNNMGGKPDHIADELKRDHHVEILCIGLGPEVNKEKLAAIASMPHKHHIYYLEDYVKLDEIVRNITSSERDYSKCGKAGTNFEKPPPLKAGSGEYPWMAAIYKDNRNGDKRFDCGGTLIARNWVLTAAHCINQTNITDFTVLLGLTNRKTDEHDEKSQEFNVTEAIWHEDYWKRDVPLDDIGLLKLNRDAVLGPYVRTVCLPYGENTVRTLTDLRATVSGWGRQSTGEERFKMKKLLMRIDEGNRMCVINDGAKQLCAGLPGREEHVEKGDSGGPLVVLREAVSPTFVQVGVVSFSHDCREDSPPTCREFDLYTRVTYYVDWITNTMREHE
ncbi:complement factor B-like [Diadema antillarum]|uniref:complement factor B-like n=1 Tax=Diadema antillarum TaxID=105358 RepID=UPI003A837EBC